MKRRALLKGLATVIPALAISDKLSAASWQTSTVLCVCAED